MSRYTYAGPFKNPTEGFYVKEVDDHFEVWVREDRSADGSAPPDRPHSKGLKFEDAGDAADWIEHLRQDFEDDYSDYLDEHHHEIVQMERYEQWKNEY